MDNLIQAWRGMDMRKKVMMLVMTLILGGTAWTMVQVATKPAMSLLYSGLDQAAAGEVIAALEQRGVAYQVNGSAILVPGSQRDVLRMTLAGEGLPAASSGGYELLDQVSAFGTTSRMFDATYLRAKEGELARTILANRIIRSARVHISMPDSAPFSAGFKPSASVAIETSGGLDEAQAQALRHLVASAVAGLSPDNVTLVDTNGTLLFAGEQDPSHASSTLENELRDKVERLLAARVGAGKVRVEVAVETNQDTEEVQERILDPQSRVLISTETSEVSENSSGSGAGGVSVASNLPQGGATGSDTSTSQNSETNERVNYEISETNRQIQRGPGAIKRLSVAVLVDGLRTPAADGTVTYAARPAEELTALTELVRSAVGFDDTRGDSVTLQSMEFTVPSEGGTTAEASLIGGLHIDVMEIVRLAILAVTVIGLGLFVVRPLLKASSVPALPAPNQIALAPPAAATSGVIEGSAVNTQALGAPDSGGAIGAFGGPGAGTADFGGNFAFGSGMDGDSGTPADRLRRLIEDKREESLAVLRSWAEEPNQVS